MSFSFPTSHLKAAPPIERGDGSRAGGIDIGDHDLGGAGAMKGLAQRLADAVAATGDDHDFAGHLHGRSPCLIDS